MMNPQEDPTSLGAVLLELGLVTREQLNAVVEQQRHMREETMLGVLLVHNGILTQTELDTALSAQRGMREANKTDQALAVANIAIGRHRRKTLLDRRERLVEKGAQIVRSISNDYPAVTADMLLAKCHTRK